MSKSDNRNFVEQIADIETDFPRWYTDVVVKTQLVDYGPVKGTMVIRPYGYAIWENIQKELDRRFKATGHKNAYFPLLIPMSFFTKEAEHVEGFAPEVAVVTHAGGEELAEPLAIRPTSETIFGNMYAKWIQSYRDLTEEEALEETMKMLGVYKEFAENCLAIPVICGRKTEKEKFAGAVATFGMEAMMKDGKSLQAGTSHYLGQNFAKAFDIKFLDRDGVQKYVYTSSWGVSTRLIGALIMAHGDQRGLVIPPVVAPVQAVIVPIAAKKGGVIEACNEIKLALEAAGVRVELDDTDNSPGWKFNEWEMRGVPVRIEVGPRDLADGKAMLFRRDTCEKELCQLEGLAERVAKLLDAVQKDMLEAARVRRDGRMTDADTVEELLDGVERGNFVRAGWCGCRECEDEIKARTAATARVFAESDTHERCAVCGKPAKHTVIFARAY